MIAGWEYECAAGFSFLTPLSTDNKVKGLCAFPTVLPALRGVCFSDGRTKARPKQLFALNLILNVLRLQPEDVRNVQGVMASCIADEISKASTSSTTSAAP